MLPVRLAVPDMANVPNPRPKVYVRVYQGLRSQARPLLRYIRWPRGLLLVSWEGVLAPWLPFPFKEATWLLGLLQGQGQGGGESQGGLIVAMFYPTTAGACARPTGGVLEGGGAATVTAGVGGCCERIV